MGNMIAPFARETFNVWTLPRWLFGRPSRQEEGQESDIENDRRISDDVAESSEVKKVDAATQSEEVLAEVLSTCFATRNYEPILMTSAHSTFSVHSVFHIEDEKAVAEVKYHPAQSVRGLHNLGNTCYFNSTMQALVHTKSRFREELESLRTKGEFAREVLKLLNAMQSDISKPYSPDNLHRLFGQRSPRFADHRQHDSHECLRNFLDNIRKEERENSGAVDKRKVLTVVDSVFGGHFITVYICEDCGTPYHVFEALLDISLPIMIDEEDLAAMNSARISSQNKSKPVKPHTQRSKGKHQASKLDKSKKVKLITSPMDSNCVFTAMQDTTGQRTGKVKLSTKLDVALQQNTTDKTPQVEHKAELIEIQSTIIHDQSMTTDCKIDENLEPETGIVHDEINHKADEVHCLNVKTRVNPTYVAFEQTHAAKIGETLKENCKVSESEEKDSREAFISEVLDEIVDNSCSITEARGNLTEREDVGNGPGPFQDHSENSSIGSRNENIEESYDDELANGDERVRPTKILVYNKKQEQSSEEHQLNQRHEHRIELGQKEHGTAEKNVEQQSHDNEPEQEEHGTAEKNVEQQSHDSEPKQEDYGTAEKNVEQRSHDSESKQEEYGIAEKNVEQRSHDSDPKQEEHGTAEKNVEQRSHDSEPEQEDYGTAEKNVEQRSHDSEREQEDYGTAEKNVDQRSHDLEPEQEEYGAAEKNVEQRFHDTEPEQEQYFTAEKSVEQRFYDTEPEQEEHGTAEKNVEQRSHDSEPEQKEHDTVKKDVGQRSHDTEIKQEELDTAKKNVEQRFHDSEPEQKEHDTIKKDVGQRSHDTEIEQEELDTAKKNVEQRSSETEPEQEEHGTKTKDVRQQSHDTELEQKEHDTDKKNVGQQSLDTDLEQEEHGTDTKNVSQRSRNTEIEQKEPGTNEKDVEQRSHDTEPEQEEHSTSKKESERRSHDTEPEQKEHAADQKDILQRFHDTEIEQKKPDTDEKNVGQQFHDTEIEQREHGTDTKDVAKRSHNTEIEQKERGTDRKDVEHLSHDTEPEQEEHGTSEKESERRSHDTGIEQEEHGTDTKYVGQRSHNTEIEQKELDTDEKTFDDEQQHSEDGGQGCDKVRAQEYERADLEHSVRKVDNMDFKEENKYNEEGGKDEEGNAVDNKFEVEFGVDKVSDAEIKQNEEKENIEGHQDIKQQEDKSNNDKEVKDEAETEQECVEGHVKIIQAQDKDNNDREVNATEEREQENDDPNYDVANEDAKVAEKEQEGVEAEEEDDCEERNAEEYVEVEDQESYHYRVAIDKLMTPLSFSSPYPTNDERATKKYITVDDCLSYFTREEHITKEYLCNDCYGRNPPKEGEDPMLTSATKQTLIFNPPAILTLHLKRFELKPGGSVKRNDMITYEELLDIAPYCSSMCLRNDPPCQNIWYSLYGVVVHHGSTLKSGHYTAYIKMRENVDPSRKFLQRNFFDRDLTRESLIKMMHDKLPGGVHEQRSETWYCMNDSWFQKVPIKEVLNQEAYLLFYERLS